jgi:hypothetical protein
MVEKPTAFFFVWFGIGGSHTVTHASSRADMQYDSVFKTAACSLTRIRVNVNDLATLTNQQSVDQRPGA